MKELINIKNLSIEFPTPLNLVSIVCKVQNFTKLKGLLFTLVVECHMDIITRLSRVKASGLSVTILQLK